MPPLISVIFVTHGDRIDVVRRLLSSVEGYKSYPWIEFIGIDNGTNPSASKCLNTHYPFVKWIRNPENRGTSRAYNAGIRMTRGDYLMIINDDTVIPANMLDRIAQFLQDSFSHDGIALGLRKNDNDFQAIRLRILNIGKTHPNKPIKATFTGTGNLLIRRSVIEKVGFYDENYFAGNEDMDLSLRLKRAGARIYYYPEFYIYHFHVYKEKKTGWADFILARRLSDIYYAQKFYLPLAFLARVYALRNFKKRFHKKISRDTYQKARSLLFIKRNSYYEVQKCLIEMGIDETFNRYILKRSTDKDT